jgi:DNA replication protein DnaC
MTRHINLTEQEALILISTWKTNPDDVPDLEHQLHCVDGCIAYSHPHYSDAAFKCPICQAQLEQHKREQELRTRMTQASIPARYLELEWNDLDMLEPLPSIQDACMGLNTILLEGESLYLHGPPGSGKTQAAIMIAKTAVRSGFSTRVVNMGRLCVRVRQGYSDQRSTDQHNDHQRKQARITEEDALEMLGTPDFLILDDLGAGEARQAVLEQRLLYLGLEERQNRRLPTIITSNLAADALIERLGSRLLNRLQPLTVLEVVHGKNFRFPEHRQQRWTGDR